MPFFQKKPVVIEAVQYTGDNLKEVLEFTSKHPKFSEWFSSFEDYENHVKHDNMIFKIITNQGTLLAYPNDWIIKGTQGEFYPCKPDIFEATYDPMIKKLP